ncbi:hypothetical protein QYC27_07240 [Thermosynechococcus sp. PP45]|uniref:hypothetical protein n=2 Tax=Thermosynechococcus TaxID=146785 RepID=UPI002670ED0F|nr:MULTISPECIES: hypothetical protein [unclassified Thermosynechococcus]WKT80093.1 hypothetical protein QYC27_07240 [Thermosynechococcus sp. PP45]WNC23703.1 hypothetical protein RHH26_07235 [Thermosynechococcus sp. PP551]WNC26279.1 hypothetical protein RHH27_07230 [Thermosynechococcus sp. PP555]
MFSMQFWRQSLVATIALSVLAVFSWTPLAHSQTHSTLQVGATVIKTCQVSRPAQPPSLRNGNYSLQTDCLQATQTTPVGKVVPLPVEWGLVEDANPTLMRLVTY